MSKSLIVRKNSELLVYLPNGRLLFQFDKSGFPDNGFASRLQLGRGAGCKGGATAYLAFNSGSRNWQHQYRGGFRSNGKAASLLSRLFKIEVGITRNANI